MSNHTESETQRRRDKGKGGMRYFMGRLLKEIEEGEIGGAGGVGSEGLHLFV